LELSLAGPWTHAHYLLTTLNLLESVYYTLCRIRIPKLISPFEQLDLIGLSMSLSTVDYNGSE